MKYKLIKRAAFTVKNNKTFYPVILGISFENDMYFVLRPTIGGRILFDYFDKKTKANSAFNKIVKDFTRGTTYKYLCCNNYSFERIENE